MIIKQNSSGHTLLLTLLSLSQSLDLELLGILEIWTTGTQDHLMGLRMLTLCGDGHVTEGLFVPQVLERSDHVGLEIIPAKAKLLIVGHGEIIFKMLSLVEVNQAII